jgi:glycosyltransferase involved in cell wall biosynthesis
VSSLVLLSFALLIFRPCKVVVSIEGLGSWAVSPLRRAFLRFLLNLEGIVSTVCNRDEQQAVGNARTFLINGIGVNLVDFDFTINEHRRRNVLFVGRLIRDKGILDFFRLVELSIAKGLDIKFVVVGDVYANNPSSLTADEIDNFAALYGSFIEFVGYQHDVRHFFDDALCLVLPSSREGFPVVVMEASASGVPALVYNVPGSLDSVQEGINGFIVDFGMVERLFDTILWLRNLDLVKYQDLQCSCRSYALDNFDEESYVLRFLNVVLR